MNLMLQRLAAVCLSAMAVFGVADPSVAWSAHSRLDTGISSATAAVAADTELHLACGTSQSFHASSPVNRIEVADPDIACVVSVTGMDLTISALKPGTTQIKIWSEASDDPFMLVLHVQEKSATNDDPAVIPAGLLKTFPGIAPALPGLPVGADTNYVQHVPAISLETTSPVMAVVGKVVEQQILVKNVGSVPAEHVVISGNVSIDAELVSTEPKADVSKSTLVWRFATIPAGAQQKITVRVKPLSTGELSLHTKLALRSSTTVKTQVRAPKLQLTCDGPTSVVVGSEVRVNLTVVNVGSAPAEGVTIRQVVPEVTQASHHVTETPMPMNIGTLLPGESRVLVTTSVARDPGLACVSLIAQSQDGARSTAEHSITITAPKLTLITAGPEFQNLNCKAAYQLVLTNPGDAMATNVNLMAGLPEGLEFIEASSDGTYNHEKRTVSWFVGLLDVHEQREYTITVLPKTEGEHRQRAVAWADKNLLAKADRSTRVEGTVLLLLEVVDTNDPIELDNETTYQIHLVNRGSKAAEQVQLEVAVPEGLKILGVEGSNLYRMQGQQIKFEPIASLAGQSATVLQVRVKGVKAGTQRLRAVMNCPGVADSIITEESTEVYGD